MGVQCESEDVFLVSSSSGKHIYRVVKNDINCLHFCIHKYCCTCRDNTITFNMSKHIYSMCMYQYQMNDKKLPINETIVEIYFFK